MEKAYKLLFNTEESDDLYVYCCGLSQTESGHSFGPALKPHFMIHFVLSGKGSFTIGGKKYPLTEYGQKAADCWDPGDGISGNDALAVQMLDSKTITSLPYISAK